MLTQDDYKLYTGETSNFSEDDWSKMVSMSAVRLAGMLCLEELPTDDSGNLPSDLAMVLANFIYLVLSHRGSDSRVTSKKVRNFSINYGSDGITGAFAKLGENYGDILDKYSNCGSTLSVERNTRCCCGRL